MAVVVVVALVAGTTPSTKCNSFLNPTDRRLVVLLAVEAEAVVVDITAAVEVVTLVVADTTTRTTEAHLWLS
jgi:hypothetical protein